MLSICPCITRLKKLGSSCPTYLEGLNIPRAQEQALSISTRRTVPRVQEQALSSAWVGRTLLPPGGQSAGAQGAIQGGCWGASLCVSGPAALSSQINEHPFTVPGTQRACPRLKALARGALHPDLGRQSLSHFLASHLSPPQGSPPGPLCLKEQPI